MERTIPQTVREMMEKYPELTMQLWKDQLGTFRTTSYQEFYHEFSLFAAGLQTLGVQRGDHVGIISDNRKEWLIADLALLALGAADVPRGRDAMPQEVEFILSYTDCRICLVENSGQLEKILALLPQLKNLEILIMMDPYEDYEERKDITILKFLDVQNSGKPPLEETPQIIEKEIDKGKPTDLATIIFTSGTTGDPKGVMISHRNFMHQVDRIPQIISISPGDRWLSVLPVWHSFERILQYVILGTGSSIAYSKPIGKVMLPDFQNVNPMWMGSVPRIWESVMTGVYQSVKKKSVIARGLFSFFVLIGSSWKRFQNMLTNRMPQFHRRIYVLDILIAIIPFILLTPLKYLGNLLVFKTIKQKLGKNFIAGVSGGGSLPSSVDRFFSAIGITLLDGYGLTETSPVIALRRIDNLIPNTMATFPDTEYRILTEEGKEAKPGEKGVIHVRGNQVMMGYFKRDDLTKLIIDEEGWLNTGDIGVWTYTGDFAIRGRAKDTIVLAGGENIEPVPIESKLRESPYIDQAVILGQDQKFLAALIVPNKKELEHYCMDNGIPYLDRQSLLDVIEIDELINAEIQILVGSKTGFKSFEHIFRFALLDKQFEIGVELSAKQEIKRHVINDLYKEEIQALFTR